MIREAQMNEKFHYRYSESGHIYHFYKMEKTWEIFVNDDNYLHNDIGRAFSPQNEPGRWFWNGIYIE